MAKSESATHPWMKAKMTPEQIEAHRKHLSETLGNIRVHVFCFEENEKDGQVIGFLREPSLQTKLRALDNIGQEKIFLTGSTLLDSLLIVEHSDPRILSGNPDYDQYYLGAATECITLCKAARNSIKKK